MKMLITLAWNTPYTCTYYDQILHTYTFFEIGMVNDKVKKNIKKKIVFTHGFEPMCVRLLGHHVLYSTLEEFTDVTFRSSV